MQTMVKADLKFPINLANEFAKRMNKMLTKSPSSINAIAATLTMPTALSFSFFALASEVKIITAFGTPAVQIR